MSIFEPSKQVNHSNLEALRKQNKTGQRQIHLAPFKGPDLGAVEAAHIGEFVLGQATLDAQLPQSLSQPLLKLLPLHLPQFGATLRKDILLIRRVEALMWKCVAVVVLTVSAALAQDAPNVLTNDTVIKLVQAGVPNSTIISTINSADRVEFRFIGPEVQRLVDAKVPDDVFKAMAARDKLGDKTPSGGGSARSSVAGPPAAARLAPGASTAGSSSAGDKQRQWKVGRVMDSTSSQATFQTGATTNTNSTSTATANTFGNVTTYPNGASLNATTNATGQSHQTSTTVMHHITVRDTELVIMGDDYDYVIDDHVTVHGPLLPKLIANRKHGCRFVIGEDVGYSQEKGKLWILDADNKECKLDIIRQARVQ